MILPELKQKKNCDASLVSNLDKKKKKVDFSVKTLSFETIKYIWSLIENVLKFNETYHSVNNLFDYVYDIELGISFKDEYTLTTDISIHYHINWLTFKHQHNSFDETFI